MATVRTRAGWRVTVLLAAVLLAAVVGWVVRDAFRDDSRDDSRDTEPAGRTIESIALASAVDLRATGCRAEAVRGAGSMIAGRGVDGQTVDAAVGDGYILTAAHVVAGAETITVRAVDGVTKDPVVAVLLAIDPVNDVALLGAQLDLPVLRLAQLASGDEGVAIVFRDDRAIAQPYTVVNPAIVNIADIYGENTISRPGYRVAIEIDPGDSGAVLVGPGGQAGGVLYAKSRSTGGNAFATSMSTVAALVDAAADVDTVTGIDTGKCP